MKICSLAGKLKNFDVLARKSEAKFDNKNTTRAKIAPVGFEGAAVERLPGFTCSTPDSRHKIIRVKNAQQDKGTFRANKPPEPAPAL